jgi:hypothetical protein
VRKLTPLELPPWALPLLAIGISVPIVAGFAVGGPAVGMAIGALVAAAIVVIAARTRFDEEIEVAPARPASGAGVLVVATAAVEGEAVEAVRRARDASGREDPDVLVLAPALNRPISHWLSDLRRARLEAQERLAVSLAVLAAAGVDARGKVGDTDPVQATEDELRTFAASEVVFVTGRGTDDDAVADVRRRLDRPVAHAVATEPGPAGDGARERSPS